MIVALFALGVPGVIAIGFVIVGVWSPFDANADVVDDGTRFFALGSPVAPAPSPDSAIPASAPAESTAPVTSSSAEQSTQIAAADIAPAAETSAQTVSASSASDATSSTTATSSSASVGRATASSSGSASYDTTSSSSTSSTTITSEPEPTSTLPEKTVPTPVANQAVQDAANAALTEELASPTVEDTASTELAPAAESRQRSAAPAFDTAGPVDPWIELARAYALLGALLAGLTSVLHWLLPYLANHPSEGATDALARRVAHIQSAARGFGWVEYPLLIAGTLIESMALLRGIEPQPLHLTILMLYAALWLFQILLWLKRPVVGRVVTPRQQPVDFALVRAVNSATNRVVATATTDSSGRFDFHIHAGTYTISAQKEGYESSTVTETVRAGDTPRLMLALSPLGEQRPTVPAAPVAPVQAPAPATEPAAPTAAPVQPLEPLNGTDQA